MGSGALAPTNILYSQVPNRLKRPPLIKSFDFSNPWALIGPPFIKFEENEVFCELFSIIPFFTSNFPCNTIQALFQGKIACFCMYFSYPLCNMLLFLPLRYNHCKVFLKFQPPFSLSPLPFIKFQNFPYLCL